MRQVMGNMGSRLNSKLFPGMYHKWSILGDAEDLSDLIRRIQASF